MDQVYNFWFGENANTYSENYKFNTKLWFRANAETDAKISVLFKDLLEETAQDPEVSNAKNSLCTLIILDQFPRHIYRGTANAFKFDFLSIQIAEKIINQNWIDNLSPIEALFVYFAFLHQENIEYVKKSITGFHNSATYTVPSHSKIIQAFKKSAIRHLEILEQFGRYPHRNEALGRISTKEELDFLEKYGYSLFMKSQKPPVLSINETPPINKLKILCLHGYRQNGKVFKSRIKKMINLFKDIADFYFVTSPTSYDPQGDIREATLNVYELIPNYSNQCVWWLSSENNEIYFHANESLAFLKKIWEKEGGFDGILGFAQGGTLASIMSCRGFDPQFIILISSYIPRAKEFADMNVEQSLKTPSLHILGKNDILVVPERSRKLHELFVSGKIIEHEGGHFVPKFWPYDEIKNFICQFQFTPKTKDITSNTTEIDWKKLILSTNSDNVESISKIISNQLQKDFAIGYNLQQVHCTDKFHFDKPDIIPKEMCPSKCVDAIIGKKHRINKKFFLSKLIAKELFPEFSELKQNACFERAIQILKRMRFHKSDSIVNHYLEARASESRRKMLENIPLSHHITNPKPELVTECPLEELTPLLEFLHNDLPVNQQIQFPRGTLTTDGRLDLCKQVVGPRGIGPLLNSMHDASCVKRLLLGNNIVSDSGAKEIALEMKVSKLECWYIAGNEFTLDGIIPIAEALKDNIYCTSLWLKRNPLGPLSMDPISSMLLFNKKIQVLDLVNCGILDSGLKTLISALSGPNRNITLRVLWLDANGITYNSANIIADYISNWCELTDLSLSCNRLCDNGVEVISLALKSNSILQRLSLASNRIGPSGAKYLSEALRYHTSINFLNLGYTRSTNAVHELGNFIGDEGTYYIADLLKNNSTIRHLDLLHNSISQIGVNHIISALETNTTLVKLQLTQFGKVHNEPGKENIKAKLTENYERLNQSEKIVVDKIILPSYVEDIYSVYRTKF